PLARMLREAAPGATGKYRFEQFPAPGSSPDCHAGAADRVGARSRPADPVRPARDGPTSVCRRRHARSCASPGPSVDPEDTPDRRSRPEQGKFRHLSAILADFSPPAFGAQAPGDAIAMPGATGVAPGEQQAMAAVEEAPAQEVAAQE